jgi:hypothetical protein
VQPNYIFMAFVPHMAISATEGLGTRALKERTIATQIHGLFLLYECPHVEGVQSKSINTVIPWRLKSPISFTPEDTILRLL